VVINKLAQIKMTKVINILLTVLIFVSCSDKDKTIIIETYDDGSKQVVYYYPNYSDKSYYEREFYHPNGQLGSKGYISNDEMIGPWYWWYDNGKPEAHSIYINGQEKDSTYCYYESGKIARKLFQIDTIKDLWFLTDYFENGQKRVETYLVGKDRIIDSLWRKWDKDGKLIQEGQMDSSKKVGTWKIIGEKDSLKYVEMDGTKTLKFN